MDASIYSLPVPVIVSTINSSLSFLIKYERRVHKIAAACFGKCKPLFHAGHNSYKRPKHPRLYSVSNRNGNEKL